MVYNISQRFVNSIPRIHQDTNNDQVRPILSLERNQLKNSNSGNSSTILRLSQCCLSEFVPNSIPKSACNCWSNKNDALCSHLSCKNVSGTYYRAFQISEGMVQSPSLALVNLLLYVEESKSPIDKYYLPVQGIAEPPFLSRDVANERNKCLCGWPQTHKIQPGFYILQKIRNIHVLQELGPEQGPNGFVFFSPNPETPTSSQCSVPCACQLVESKKSLHRDLLAKLLVRRISAVQQLSKGSALHVSIIQAKLQAMAVLYGLHIEMEPFSDSLPVDPVLCANEWYRRLSICINTLSRVAMVAASASSHRTGDNVVYYINTSLVQSVIADMDDLCLRLTVSRPETPAKFPAKRCRSLLTEAIRSRNSQVSDTSSVALDEDSSAKADTQPPHKRNRHRIKRCRKSRDVAQDRILPSLRNILSVEPFSDDMFSDSEFDNSDAQSIHLSFWDDADMSLLGVFEQQVTKRQQRRRRRNCRGSNSAKRVQKNRDFNVEALEFNLNELFE